MTLEFLEIAVHEILYVWKVYPLVSFKKVYKYGICLHQNKHPGVCKYIEKVLLSANLHLEKPRTQRKTEKVCRFLIFCYCYHMNVYIYINIHIISSISYRFGTEIYV